MVTASYTMSWTSVHSSSGTLSIRSNPLNIFVTSTVYTASYTMSWTSVHSSSGEIVQRTWAILLTATKRILSHLHHPVVLNTHWKDWCWSWSSDTWATWCEEPTLWKRLWFWKGLKAGGEGDDREWDGWMASPTQWTGVWANSRRQWREAWRATVHGVTKSQTRLSD